MTKKSKKTAVPKLLKSKLFLFGLAGVVAVGVIAGYSSYAHSRPWIPTPCVGGVIKAGSTGSCVTAAQKSLNYLCEQTPYLVVDGKFGSAMTSRVRGYQNTVPTTPDGIIGPTTWKSIYSRVNSTSYFNYPHKFNCKN